jgi:UrcA family protein
VTEAVTPLEKIMNASSRFIVALAATLGALVAIPSYAAQPLQQQQQILTQRVRFADLNLHSPQGNAALYERLNFAAHRVCDDGDDWFLNTTDDARQCRSQAIAGAVEQIHSPMLTALYQENDGRYPHS